MNREPLVLCLTNSVAATFTANCLLAIGARPAMVEEPSEAAELAAVADALLVNLGTVTARQAEAMRRAVEVARARRAPWVLDPVGVQFLSFRRQLARELLALRPSLIRGNRAEVDFLSPTDVPALATGETDVVRLPPPDGDSVAISGGSPLLQAVTATGCAQGGVCAALLGRGLTPREACLSASRLFKRAGERAAERARAPGSFLPAFIDALWELAHD